MAIDDSLERGSQSSTPLSQSKSEAHSQSTNDVLETAAEDDFGSVVSRKQLDRSYLAIEGQRSATRRMKGSLEDLRSSGTGHPDLASSSKGSGALEAPRHGRHHPVSHEKRSSGEQAARDKKKRKNVETDFDEIDSIFG